MDDSHPDWQQRCREFVGRHVFYCVSGLVDTLARAHGTGSGERDLEDLCEEAFNLCEPRISDETRKEWLAENNYWLIELDDRWIITGTTDAIAYTEALEDAGYSVVQRYNTADWDLVHEDDDGGDVTETKVIATFTEVDEVQATIAACQFLKIEPFYDEAAEGDDEAEALEAFFEDGDHDDELREMAGEIYEHWIVSDYLSNRLEERGERVGRLDNLIIWGRGCTGQAILLDGVIQDIVKEYHRD